VDDSIDDKNDEQTVKEIADIKDDSQLHEDGQNTKDAIKPKDTPTHPLDASPPSPPSPFENDAANNTKENPSSVSAHPISLDSVIVCKDESNRLYTCPHCTKFKSNLESEYERHIVLNHPRKPGYPNTAAAG